MAFFRKEYCSGSYALLQGIFLTQGLNPQLMFPALAGGFFTTIATWEALYLKKLGSNSDATVGVSGATGRS